MLICSQPQCQTTAGCVCHLGMTVMDHAKLTRIAELEAQLADREEKLARLKEDLRVAHTNNRALRVALRTCIARAGVPDPVEACRLVIGTAENALGK